MTGRGTRTYYPRGSRIPISDEDKYTMLMLYQHQKLSIRKIARMYRLEPVQVRIIIGKRSGGSCCG